MSGCVVAGVVLTVLFATGGDSSGRAGQPKKAATHVTRPKPPPQLPRGGRTVLPGHLVVAYYGIVGTSNILGRTNDPRADAEGVERQARAYAKFGQPVLPAFELRHHNRLALPGTLRNLQLAGGPVDESRATWPQPTGTSCC